MSSRIDLVVQGVETKARRCLRFRVQRRLQLLDLPGVVRLVPISRPSLLAALVLEPRPLPSTGVTRLPRYYGPIRHLKCARPIPRGNPVGRPRPRARLPVLRAFPCVRAAAITPAEPRRSCLAHPSSDMAFPVRVVGSACASSFSRPARRSLTLRPAHSLSHQSWSRYSEASASPLPPECLGCFRLEQFAGWDSHPLKTAALARRTPTAAVRPSTKQSSRGTVRATHLARMRGISSESSPASNCAAAIRRCGSRVGWAAARGRP